MSKTNLLPILLVLLVVASLPCVQSISGDELAKDFFCICGCGMLFLNVKKA